MPASRVNLGRAAHPGRYPGARATGLARRAASRLRASALAESDRWPLWMPVAMGTGIGVYFALPWEPSGWAGALLVAMASALLVAARRRPLLWWGAAALAAAAAGFAAAQVRTALIDGPRLVREIGPATVSGRVVLSEAVEKGQRIVLDQVRIQGLAAPETPERVRIRLIRSDASPAPGIPVELRAVLTPLPEPTMPGAFDFQRHAFFQGLGAVGFAVGRVTVRPDQGQPSSWAIAIESIRQNLDARLRRGVAGEGPDDPRASIASALITGKRADIPEDVLNAMRDSGLAHLLAISGMNFVFVAGLVFAIVRSGLALIPPVALRAPIRKWAAIVALIVAFFYLLLSGATPPTQRAFLMLAMALLAILVDRLEISMRPVAWAAAGMLLVAPDILVGASFQMSFAAVIALVAAYEAIRGRWSSLRSRLGAPVTAVVIYVGGVGFTTIVAGLATAPFSLFHFNQFATYGLLANLLAVPVTAFWVMPAALAAFMVMPFGLEGAPLRVMGSGIDVIVSIAQMVAGLPGAVRSVPAIPDSALVLASLGGLWLALWTRPWRLLGLLPICTGAMIAFAASPPDLMIAAEGRLVGVRGADGTLLVSTLRADRFVREAWEVRTASAPARAWPRNGVDGEGALRCDRLGCIHTVGPHRIALPREERALADDCASATAIIGGIPVRPKLRRAGCGRVPVIIDRLQLLLHGGHALWLEPDGGVRVETVRAGQGRRPWVVGLPPARGAAPNSGARARSAGPGS